jgi:phospholipid/cholesterol/gamma-HCH transport system ATP-binding protein
MSTGNGQTDHASPIVRLVNLRKSFGRHRVLRGIDLTFARGKTIVILGPSGCGKTVLIKHIIGLLRPDYGEVWFQDHRIDSLSESQLVTVRREIGFLFQQGALFDSMSVCENVEFPLVEHTTLSPEQRQERVENVLRMVGMVASMNKMPALLSGGQRKRVALARAIVLDPTLILYDEPTTGLDPIRSDVINELIIKLKEEMHVTSIVVTHDLVSAFKVADYMIMLYDGLVVMQGKPEDLRNSDNPVVQRFLRGEATADELAEIRIDAGGLESSMRKPDGD